MKRSVEQSTDVAAVLETFLIQQRVVVTHTKAPAAGPVPWVWDQLLSHCQFSSSSIRIIHAGISITSCVTSSQVKPVCFQLAMLTPQALNFSLQEILTTKARAMNSVVPPWSGYKRLLHLFE